MSELETHGWPEMDPIKPDQRITVVYYNRSLLRHLAVAVLSTFSVSIKEKLTLSAVSLHTQVNIYIYLLVKKGESTYLFVPIPNFDNYKNVRATSPGGSPQGMS